MRDRGLAKARRFRYGQPQALGRHGAPRHLRRRRRVLRSGYLQAPDLFGDGARIPMIVVWKCSAVGHNSRTYAGHVSTLKLIEANWRLSPITNPSRDNLPNPITKSNPDVPVNQRAIGDMMDMFDFGHKARECASGTPERSRSHPNERRGRAAPSFHPRAAAPLEAGFSSGGRPLLMVFPCRERPSLEPLLWGYGRPA